MYSIPKHMWNIVESRYDPSPAMAHCPAACVCAGSVDDGSVVCGASGGGGSGGGADAGGANSRSCHLASPWGSEAHEVGKYPATMGFSGEFSAGTPPRGGSVQ